MADKKQIHNQWTIHQLMDQYGYSLRDLAPMTGLSASMLCRLFKGEGTFLTKHKLCVAKVFQIDEKNIIWPIKQYHKK